MNKKIFLTFLIALIFLPSNFCLHFLIKEGTPKCIFDEIPKN
jgi:hypothetical protein